MKTKTTENIYKKRLRAFLEGLEMEQIDTIIDSKPEFLKELGTAMKQTIQDLK